jgi:hypothetical protein
MRNGFVFVAAAGLCAWLLAAPARAEGAADAPAAPLPSWVGNPKSDDSIFLYRVGCSEGKKDKTAAQQAAYENALAVIVNEMLARAGVEESLRPDVAAHLPVRNAELVPGSVYTVEKQAGFACWVQVSWPLAEKAALLALIEPEKKKALERVEFGRRLAAHYAGAKAAHSRGEYESARTNLQTVIRNYASLRAPAFDLEEAQLLLGDACGAQKDFLAARQSYEEVQQNSASDPWKESAALKLKGLPKAPRAWPLHDRWKGRKVALLCAVREAGQAPRPLAPLGEVLGSDCRESRLDYVDVSGDIGADAVAALFDQRSCAAVEETAKRKGAGVVLAVLLTMDPAKRGQTQDMMGVAMPVADSEVSFLLVDVEGAKISYGGRFPEVAGTRSEARLSDRVASILLEKHLVPKCPALASPP